MVPPAAPPAATIVAKAAEGEGRGRLGHGPGRLWPWPRRPGVRGEARETPGRLAGDVWEASQGWGVRHEDAWKVTDLQVSKTRCVDRPCHGKVDARSAISGPYRDPGPWPRL